MRPTREWAWAWVLVGLAGCGASLIDEAKQEFAAGHYSDAKETLLKVNESEYQGADAHKRTVYALYRGLVMGALGDRTEARAWLGLAMQTEEQHPGSLGQDDVARLKLADEEYGPLPLTAPAAPPE